MNSRSGFGGVGLLLAFGCLSCIDRREAVQTPSACVEPRTPALDPFHRPGPNPFLNETLYVDPTASAARLADEWRTSRPDDAALLKKIAAQPQADWLGEWSGDIGSFVRRKVNAIRGAGALPVFVVYNVPGRDCGQYSAGGARSSDAYLTWISNLASGMGDSKAVLILEPDALGLLDQCYSQAQQSDRLAMIEKAVRTLKAHGSLAVYIDAGNAGWIHAEQMAKRLSAAGMGLADGFSLNVSNYVSTEESLAYGREISRQLGGAHFIIDTSRNGNGRAGDHQWCNPDGRALGTPPTTRTGEPLCDAFLWIKRPGESDGTCNGGPRAGQFWPEYALGLAKRAKF